MRWRVVVDVYEDGDEGQILLRRNTSVVPVFADAMELSDLACEAIAEAQDVDDDIEARD
jgi:hypothetical protein